MTRPRYDPDEDVSRHAASSSDDCQDIEDKYGWDLKRVEELPETTNQVFEVDCVFEGRTEFPTSYYDADKEKEDA
jgi:hypothetical protein